MGPGPENPIEDEDLNEGVLKSIVRSIFLRHRMHKKEEEPDVLEEHVDNEERPE